MLTDCVTTALQTALSLAEFEAEKEGHDTITIKRAHLKQVVELSTDFKRYIASMHGNKTDAQIAKREGLRNDSFGDPPRKQQKKKMSQGYIDRDKEDDPPASKVRANASKKRVEDDYEKEERGKLVHKRNTKKGSKPFDKEEEEEEEEEEEKEEEEEEEEEEKKENTPQPKRRTKAPAYSEEEEDERSNGNTRTKALPRKGKDYERHRSNSRRPKQLERRDSRMTSRASCDEEEDSHARAPRRKSKKIHGQMSEDDDEE